VNNEQQAQLIALAACLNSVIAEACADLDKFGQWSCDYGTHMRTYRARLDDMLGIKDAPKGPAAEAAKETNS